MGQSAMWDHAATRIAPLIVAVHGRVGPVNVAAVPEPPVGQHDGWELVSVVSLNNGDGIAYWKRQKLDSEK